MAVIQETRSIEAGMGRLIKAMKNASILIIPIVMLFFSICGSVFGMAEETIPFIPIFVSLCLAMGFDSITGVAIVFLRRGRRFCRCLHESVYRTGCTGHRRTTVAFTDTVQSCDVCVLRGAGNSLCYEICHEG